MPLEHSPRETFPQAGLRGTRVLLRPFVEEDIGEPYIGWLNDPVVVRYSNQRFRAHDAKSARTYLSSFAAGDNLFLAVCRADGGALIGTLTAYAARHHGTADIGILIGDKEVWGGGYGRDAWQTLLDWLLLQRGMRKVTAGTLACNRGMVRIMERTGMHHEATRRQQELVDGVAEDILYYAKFAAA